MYQQVTTKNNLGTMEGWKNFSPLVEINLDSTLQQPQEGLIEDGHALRKLLEAVYPDADAVCSKLEEIKSQLEDHPVDISDRWVTAHVNLGEKKRFISKRLVRQVSMFIFFLRQLCFMCICSIFLSCLGNIGGSPRLRARVF
jgi:hypothetical protein